MKVSRNWLQKYVSRELPKGDDFVNLLALNLFEVENAEVLANGDEIFDVKVLPDRNAYCLSHRGIARELAVLIDADFKIPDILATPVTVSKSLALPEIDIVKNPVCRKYLARNVSNIVVIESPEWLKSGLESLGQRSINSIVDATNYVMLDSGQPLHAFDADLVKGNIQVRLAKDGEKMTTLDNKEIVLDKKTLVIADDDGPLAIAGVKGGNRAGVSRGTKNIILESANFSPSDVRRVSGKINIRNESSKRFENNLPFEFADVGMNDLSLLIAEMCKDAEFSPIFYFGPEKDVPYSITTTSEFLRDCIGIKISDEQIISILNRCDISVTEHDAKSGKITVSVPTYRKDLVIAEDLAEEVGRIYGYDKIVDAEPVRIETNLKNDIEFQLAEKIRHLLIQIGFDEIIGYTLRGDGDYVLEKPLSNDKNKLRRELNTSTAEYLESNSRYLDLLGIPQAKIFEISRVFEKSENEEVNSGEKTVLSMGVINQKGSKAEKAGDVLLKAVEYLSSGGIIIDTDTLSKVSDSVRKGAESKLVYDRKMEMLVLPQMDLAKMSMDEDEIILDEKKEKVEDKDVKKMFSKISAYPFATRDIAILVPGSTGQEKLIRDFLIDKIVKAINKENFVRMTLFDIFTKNFDGEEKTSYAFRIVFQSHTETLKDELIDSAMKKINEAVLGKGWVVR